MLQGRRDEGLNGRPDEDYSQTQSEDMGLALKSFRTYLSAAAIVL